jgi:hypothetical protein
MRFVIAAFVAVASFAANGAQAETTDDYSLKPYVVQMVSGAARKVGGSGVYLGRGFVLTASHVGGQGVRIGDFDYSARTVKVGTFQTIDLRLLFIAEEKLPDSVRALHMPLCEMPPQPDEPVMLAAPQSITRSRIESPSLLPPNMTKYWPMISDVETSGKSGSGVFDAENKCLLGILSALISGNNNNPPKAIGTYFVPASIIRSFVPAGTSSPAQLDAPGAGTSPNGRPIGSPGSGRGSPEQPY